MVNYVNGTSSSACELVCELVDFSRIDRDIAQALYVGIVTDTGCFRFSSTSRKTMEVAGRLMTYGFDFPTIVREVYFEKTWVQQRVLGRALMKSKSYLGGKIIVSRLAHETILSLGGVGRDVEGIVSALVSTAGADCSIFAHERSTGEWRVSFRSNSIVNVAEIAQRYGGGGHIRASGCTIGRERNIEMVIREMVEAAAAQLRAAEEKG
jgi:phosphoesterase RecJ-like protein